MRKGRLVQGTVFLKMSFFSLTSDSRAIKTWINKYFCSLFLIIFCLLLSSMGVICYHFTVKSGLVFRQITKHCNYFHFIEYIIEAYKLNKLLIVVSFEIWFWYVPDIVVFLIFSIVSHICTCTQWLCTDFKKWSCHIYKILCWNQSNF